MALFGIMILIAWIIIAGFNIIFSAWGYAWYWAVIAVIGLTILVILIDGFFAFLVRRMPEAWFRRGTPLTRVSKKEERILEKFFFIKAWKDHVPELGGFTSFHKNKVSDPHNNEYIERYILEASYGAGGHYAGAVFGFLIILADPFLYMNGTLTYGLSIAIPVGIVNFIMCMMPAMVLRYNIPRLLILFKANERRDARKKKQEN